MNKIYIDWEDFGIMVEELAEDIMKTNYEYDGVYGFPRGGLPVAVTLSHRLGLPLLRAEDVTLRTLIIDDINDTGETLSHVKGYNHIAVLYSTPWSPVKPDFFVRYKVLKDSWIIFPWENMDSEGDINMEEDNMEEVQTTIPEFE